MYYMLFRGRLIKRKLPNQSTHSVDYTMNDLVAFLDTKLGQRLMQGYMNLRKKRVRSELCGLIESISEKPAAKRREQGKPLGERS